MEKTNSSKVNVRFLVNETLQKGTLIDRKIDGSNTLLHLAVEYDLVECVVKLLSSGANSNIVNSNGYTAKDIALNNGNQIMMQILGRREDYKNHLQLCHPSDLLDSANIQWPRSAHSPRGGEPRLTPLTLGAVYEDYLDWTDSKRCLRLKVLRSVLGVAN